MAPVTFQIFRLAGNTPCVLAQPHVECTSDAYKDHPISRLCIKEHIRQTLCALTSPPFRLMASFRMWSAFSSKRHPLKGIGVNADFAAAHERFLGVFDGVSGVAPKFLPEALSQDLRDSFVRLMTARFEGEEYPQQFDEQVKQALGIKKQRQAHGQRLVHLMALALYQGSRAGAAPGEGMKNHQTPSPMTAQCSQRISLGGFLPGGSSQGGSPEVPPSSPKEVSRPRFPPRFLSFLLLRDQAAAVAGRSHCEALH